MSGDEVFSTTYEWVSCKVVLKDDEGFPIIVPDLKPAMKVPFATGVKYLLLEILELTNGDRYALEKYDVEKSVVTYRKIKEVKNEGS